MPFLSIVIPAYNEENRIGRTLEGTFEYLNAQSYDYEVLVVNDGSRDRTAEKVREFINQSSGRLRLIENPGNRGKGYAVRNGMLQARGDIALFYDADLATPTTEIIKVISPIAENQYDVVFGSRALNRDLIGQHQSFLRELRGRGGNLFLRATLGLDFRDTQCGFKAFRHEAAQSIFQLQRIDGFGFDPEILFIGQKQGWRLLEMPVRWNHVEGSVVTLFGTTVKVLMEVSTIRWNDLAGKYDLKPETSKLNSEIEK
ncbi:MAG: glycosyltransferase family 2 protein [Acidobacteria bacterium]|nr:glycosyltransferase family 2 protein [Acidobacteriota bacterium]